MIKAFSFGVLISIGVGCLSLMLTACSSMAPQRSYNDATLPATQKSVGPLTVTARYQPAPTMSVLVVPEFNSGREVELMALAKTECAGRQFCSVGFWSDDATAPRQLKMSKQQMAGRIVQFAVNSKTGLSSAVWNCALASNVLGNCG